MKRNLQIFKSSETLDNQLSELYREYKDPVYGFAYKNLKSSDRANDIVQEVFEVLCQKDLAQVQNIRAFIFQITQHKVIDQLRFQAKNYQLRQDMWHIISLSHSSVDQPLIEQEYLDSFEKAKNLLTAQQRLIFEMSRREGLSHSKIAEQLNISTNTVKNHMVSALKTLREYLQVHSDMVIPCLVFFMALKAYVI